MAAESTSTPREDITSALNVCTKVKGDSLPALARLSWATKAVAEEVDANVMKIGSLCCLRKISKSLFDLISLLAGWDCSNMYWTIPDKWRAYNLFIHEFRNYVKINRNTKKKKKKLFYIQKEKNHY